MIKQNEFHFKPNPIIEASYQLSSLEQKILLTALCNLPKDHQFSDQRTYVVQYADFQNLNSKVEISFAEVRQAALRLYDRSINIVLAETSLKTRWIQDLQVNDEKQVIGIRFAKVLLPFISKLNQAFSSFSDHDIHKFTSIHAIRLYDFISKQQTQQIVITIENLRKLLTLGDRYPLYADLKRWVIEPSISQINQHTNMELNYLPKKSGKKVTEIHLSLTTKSKEEQSAQFNFAETRSETEMNEMLNAIQNVDTFSKLISSFLSNKDNMLNNNR